jgi:hypothetical protein
VIVARAGNHVDSTSGVARGGITQPANPAAPLIKVNGPTTISFLVADSNFVGVAIVAQIYSDACGYTSLRFYRVGP